MTPLSQENVEEVASVTFMSYNPTGLDSSVKCRFSNDIIEEYDVDFFSIQEHFKSTNTTEQFFRKKFPDYFAFVLAAQRSPGQEFGRAKAGMAQLTKKGVQVKKDRVPTQSYRVQAQILHLPTSRVLWLNTYLPPDPQIIGEYDDSVLREVLSETESILSQASYDDVVWGSDLNWDLARNTSFARTMSAFIERLGLVPLWSVHPVPYTHIHTDGKSRSTIDHFLISPRLVPLVAACGIVERGDNLSRHCPIWVKLKLGALPPRLPTKTWVPRRPCWSKASSQEVNEYTASLQAQLLDLKVPDSSWCVDPHCRDDEHCQDRDKFVLDLLDCVVKASHSSLPAYGGRWIGGKKKGQGKPIPGWHEDVEPKRQESIYWGDVWKKEGRPSTGWLHATYIRKKAQYHHAVRKAKARCDRTKAEKLLVAALQGDTALLKEMKIIRRGGGGPAELPDTVAGGNGEEEIVEKFKLVYSGLYNSASTNEEMQVLQDTVEKLVTPEAVSEVSRVTGASVKAAVCNMKPRKSDVSSCFTSDALLNAPDIMFEQLAIIFRSWITHGRITPSMLACSFLPLLKSSLKDPSCTGSYRAIAGSSLILKVFEKVILQLWGHLLASDSLQFGFKARTSTTQCTWLVNEVVQHLLKTGTNPIVTVLDCTKAFDLCKFSILFNRILQTGMPPVIVRCLMFMYQEQYGWVRWGQAKSETFSISNGTRQGAILSPTFWAIYCDMMIQELRKLGVGAHIAGMFMGVACYADDVVLIAPCRQAMQLMLSTVEDFATRHNISFSTDPDPRKSKSKCIFVVGKKRGLEKPEPLQLSGHYLPWVQSAVHLGHELHEAGDMNHDAVVKRAQFIQKSVEIRTMFHWAAPADVLQALKTYCSAYYGSMLWDLSGDKAAQVFSAWDTAVKLTWSCPRWTRTFLLQQVLSPDFLSARSDILGRYGNFARGLRASVSKEVRVLFNFVARDLRSTTAKNLKFVRIKSGLDPMTTGSNKLKEALQKGELCEVQAQDLWRIEYTRSLLTQLHDAKQQVQDDNVTYLQGLLDSLVL